MLTHLQIRDFAIIDQAELELHPGMTALTGETGAGKSILVDAVLLALGTRAASEVIRAGAERTEVIATLALSKDSAAARWLAEQDIEHDGEVHLRRVISADGRSRSYINGQSQPLNQVRSLGELLIDVHGQQEFLTLTRAATQRNLLDEHGNHVNGLSEVARLAGECRHLKRELESLRTAAADRDARIDLLKHQVQELDALALKPGEAERLAGEAVRLAHHGRLAEAAANALALLYEGDSEDAHARTGRALHQLNAVSEHDASLRPITALLEEALIPLKEAGRALAGYLAALDTDPRRQELVEARMATLEQLARKHRVTPSLLPERLAALSAELAALEHADSTLVTLEQRLATLTDEYRQAAMALTAERQATAIRLSGAVTALMKGLGMPGGRFEVSVTPDLSVVDPAGCDTIEFLVSANPGQPLKPIAKVASGGELSRISLAVQVAAARETTGTHCMIFDEVDAGVGGAVAEMVGRELHQLGIKGQVLCVTHLPQVAGQADRQIRVAKHVKGQTTRTELTALEGEDRVEELARMLAGVEITATAREHAREMLARKPADRETTPRRARRR